MVRELNELVQPQRCVFAIPFVVLVKVAEDAVQHCGNSVSVGVACEHLSCKRTVWMLCSPAF